MIILANGKNCVKIKLLMIILFMVSFQTHSMNTHSFVKIERCSGAECNKETTQRCQACLLTYYCCAECQHADWNNHKKVCRVYHSDIGHIQSAYRAFFDKASKTGEHKHIAQAISLHTQTLIRIEQDAACSTDKSITSISAMLEGSQLLHGLIANGICNLKDAQKMLRAEVPAAIALVKQRTLNGKLVAPYGVKTDLPQEDFIPEEEWKEKRLAVIADYEANFKPKYLS
jgi:hypothetical protein